MAKKPTTQKTITTITHDDASRKNIPTAEYQSVMRKEESDPLQIAYQRRNKDLDPQLVWRGKDVEDWSDLVVNAPPIYIQEKVHPKVLIDDLKRQTEKAEKVDEEQIDMFSDFNGVPDDDARTEFYQHDQNWTNRMILGDGLQVMASLSEREGLRGKVQCIYIDPPYGIKFNSNFQWSTTSKDVKDGKQTHITREPEQVKAFRDTWRDGIHSYLSYLRDRLTVARDLLSESGSVFVQIGDENVHRVRALMDEVFGEDNFCTQIIVRKTTAQSGNGLPGTNDYLLWYCKDAPNVKVRQLFQPRTGYDWVNYDYVLDSNGKSRRILKEEKKGLKAVGLGSKVYRRSPLTSPDKNAKSSGEYKYCGKIFSPGNGHWKTSMAGLEVLKKASRLEHYGKTLSYRRFVSDHPVFPLSDTWLDTATGGYAESKVYVVQTITKVIQRCLLMTTDPGDLVIDPTCGSGTTAHVAEQWGRRWITVDTSRVALALARARIMGARYPYYLLADTKEGQEKEATLTSAIPSHKPTTGNIRQGFVYERVPHITLKSIANNAEIDVIWENFQEKLEPLRHSLNELLNKQWEDWEIPREPDQEWSEKTKKVHSDWWKQRIACQQEIDASIAAKADFEYLYDKPYEDKSKVRVAGPFTVESLSPHRVLGVDENDELIDSAADGKESYEGGYDFAQMVLENLKTSGVQQAHKEDKITFTSLEIWPGELVCAEGRYFEGDDETSVEKRAGIFIGPEFGTVARPDLVQAAREAGDADFDVLVACAFNYDARSSEFNKLGRIPVLKARMNADLHMSDDLKNTGKGNLFVVFGEPDIDILEAEDDHIQVKVNGVDIFKPQTGEVVSDNADGIACWFIDTDYNEESFFVRQAYFLGANDPYKSLKTSLKAEINQEAWSTLNSDVSRPFEKPDSGRIAVKVINHLGDEVMKVFRVGA